MASMLFSRCYTAHDRRLGWFFGRYGRLVARHPWCIIIVSILINLILGIGILRLEFETNIEKQYFVQNSRAFQERDFLGNVFNNSEDNFHIYSLADYGYFGEVIIKTKGNKNVFNRSIYEEVLAIDQHIRRAIVLKDKYNITRSYEDLCAKNKQRCVVYGNEVLSPNFVSNIKLKNVTFPLYNGILLSSVVAKTTVYDNRLMSAEMVRFRYYLTEETEEQVTLSKLWIKKFIMFMDKLVTNQTDVAFSYYNAMEDEVQKSATAEVHLFPLTFVMMIIYASIATSGRKINCVYDLQNLGRVGVFCAIISMVPAVGIASALGVKFMNSVAIMPFLIIGIGINDMFIIVSGHTETLAKEDLSIEERMKRTLMTSGLAITVTSLTDILAFMIGYTSVFNTVKNFCVYTGLAVFFCYVNQLTILTSCIVIHQRRMDDRKHSYTCKVTETKEELKEKGRSTCYVVCCSGKKPANRSDMESILESYPKRLVQFLVRNKISKTIILLFYIAYLALSILGAVSLKQSTRYSDLALDGSNYYKACVWDYDYFPLELPIQVVFQSPLDYENKETQAAIGNLMENLKDYSLVRNDIEINWLSSFHHLSGHKLNRNHFYHNLKQFVNVTGIFKDDIIFSKDEKSITASRMYLFTRNIRTSELQAQLLLEIREIVDASGLPCTVYTPPFVFFEQYATMILSTLQTVGMAISAMFLVTCLFMPHPMIIILVTFSMISILLGVFGFLKFWGLDISVVTMLELIISVGFSVDFSAHICHAYLSSSSRDKGSRVKEALELAGGPVINGSLSTILGLLMLAFSRSFIFQSFFKVIFMVITFGLLHAVLVLPVILSLIGPKVRILHELNSMTKLPIKATEKVDPLSKPLFPKENGKEKLLLNGETETNNL